MIINYNNKPAIVLDTIVSPIDNQCLIHKVFWSGEEFVIGEVLNEELGKYKYQRLLGTFEEYKNCSRSVYIKMIHSMNLYNKDILLNYE